MNFLKYGNMLKSPVHLNQNVIILTFFYMKFFYLDYLAFQFLSLSLSLYIYIYK